MVRSFFDNASLIILVCSIVTPEANPSAKSDWKRVIDKSLCNYRDQFMMNTYIALLRGINVGGHNKLKMEVLRSFCEELGWENVQTYIQSGNIIFHALESDTQKLEKLLSNKLKSHLNLVVPVIVLESAQLKEIFLHNPFLIERNLNPTMQHVTILQAETQPEQITSIDYKMFSPDEFIIRGRAIYLFLPNGFTHTKYTNTFFEKKFNTQATARNWKTIQKLVELSELMER